MSKKNLTGSSSSEFWAGKRVFITGIGGFVGPYLAKYLLGHGATVVGQSRRRSDGRHPISFVDKGLVDQVELVELDLSDTYGLATLFDKFSPDVVFHLAAQSYVHQSFTHPFESFAANTIGTAGLLETIRVKELDPIVIFAGSSEEYGLVFGSELDLERAKVKYGVVYPEPTRIPELPINESNPLRPMSPYAVSKVHGELLMRNYQQAYGLKTIVSRAFNHEGAGRGPMFVTAAVTRQVAQLKFGEIDRITIGNVNAFRDWSHVQDIVQGYALMAEKGVPGEVYNQGSMRTNSVLSFILLSLERAGWEIRKIKTRKGDKEVVTPTAPEAQPLFGMKFEKTTIDKLLINNEIEFDADDEAILVDTNKGDVIIEFDASRFRQAEVPILLSDSTKFQRLGFKTSYSLVDIIDDQLNYYLNYETRRVGIIV